MTLAALLPKLHTMARTSLPLWDFSSTARLDLLNVSENVTYLVEDASDKAVLRVHRTGYHSRRAIESELLWLEALARDTDILLPSARPGRDGSLLQSAQVVEGEEPHYMVLFDFIDGAAPDEDSDLAPGFVTLGALAARLHQHVEAWMPPSGFERFAWDVDAVFGQDPIWGHWQEAPGVTADIHGLLVRVEARLRDRLNAFGKAPDRFNLIHADMRLANLLIGRSGTRLIDFDDCGFGWFLYDFAAAISFMEDDPRVPALKAAWLEGYRTRRALSLEDEAEIDTFVMLRRMALLAWIGSHIEAPEPQALAGDFAERTAHLGEAWLTAC